MGKTNSNMILSGLRGQIGKQIVVKQYADGMVVTSYPDRKRMKETELRKLHNDRFREAVAYARGIVNDSKKCREYKKTLRRGKTVYHAAIGEYLKKHPL